MEGLLLFILLATGMLLVMLTLLLQLHRRLNRGETVEATVRQVQVDDTGPEANPAVTITYVFLWQGQMREFVQGPRQGVLPPPIGMRRDMRYDAKANKLHEIPAIRPMIYPLLCYCTVLSFLAVLSGGSLFISNSLASMVPSAIVLIGGILVLIVAIPLRYRRNFEMQRESGVLRPVSAVFQGYAYQLDCENERIKVPVYLCSWGGKTYRMETGSGHRTYQPGESVTLYWDSRTGILIETPMH